MNGAAPTTLSKEYTGIIAVIRVIKHQFIDWKDKTWSNASKWLTEFNRGYEPKTAPEFTQHDMQRLKDWPDPDNILFMIKLLVFFGLALRLRAIEYTRIFFENIKILFQGKYPLYIIIHFILCLYLHIM